MATAFNTLAKNSMLQGLLDWNPGSVGSSMIFGAYTTDSDTAVVTSETGTYGSPSGGAMDISSTVVLSIGAGNSITHMRIQKGSGAGQYYIYKKDVTTMSFTFAGTINITSARISLS